MSASPQKENGDNKDHPDPAARHSVASEQSNGNHTSAGHSRSSSIHSKQTPQRTTAAPDKPQPEEPQGQTRPSDEQVQAEDEKGIMQGHPATQEQAQYETEVKEQDRWLPIANVARIMKTALPDNAKIAKEAKECMQECVSEFISFITSEASEKCQHEKRKTVNGEDIIFAMTSLGFENYSEALRIYLVRYREMHQEHLAAAAKQRALEEVDPESSPSTPVLFQALETSLSAAQNPDSPTIERPLHLHTQTNSYKSNVGKAEGQQAGQARSSTPGQGQGHTSSADERDETGQPQLATPNVGPPVVPGAVPGAPMASSFGVAQETDNGHARGPAGYGYPAMSNGSGNP